MPWLLAHSRSSCGGGGWTTRSFFAVQVDHRPLTASQEDYIQQLGRPCLLEELSEAWWP